MRSVASLGPGGAYVKQARMAVTEFSRATTCRAARWRALCFQATGPLKFS